jgi:dTDP-4-amino-4,6-dideoxygalactose transaminase
MVATTEAVRLLGAIPVFFDVNDDLCLEVQDYERLKAVIFVSLNGRSTGIVRARQMCDSWGIPLIEDACQSFMSNAGNKKLGTIGDVGCFSLSPHKIITSGQGGFIVTNNFSIYLAVERLKDFGRVTSGDVAHDHFGINAKFTDLQAVVALNQLKDIHARVYQKRVIWDIYYEQLKGVVEFLPKPDVPWFVDIYTDGCRYLKDHLDSVGIKTRRMYGVVPWLGSYMLGGRYPKAEKASKRGLFLPSSLDLTRKDINMVCDEIKRWAC